MIDFHSHILPSIDDGSREIAETFNLIEEAKNAGFTGIISTSHYYEGHYETDEAERKTWIEAIGENLKNKVPNMELYLGSEIYITSRITELIEQKEASSINNSRYVLFELPVQNRPNNLEDVVFKLLSSKYKPIIAHPERYEYVQKDPNQLIKLINMGVLFQSNYGSLIGMYGKKAQKTVKLLLQNNFVHFLGSDVHRENTIYPKIRDILKDLKNILPKEEIDELTTINAKLVLANEDIDSRKPMKIKQGILSKLL